MTFSSRTAMLVSFFVTACALVILSCAKGSDPNPPVFFSYAWPIGPDTERNFRSIDMETITVIDIGPDSLNYPPSIRKFYDPEILDLWHSKGKLLVRRCYDRKFGPEGRKVEEISVSELLEMWSHSMEEPGVDGISIDEFIKDDTERIDIWAEALYRMRERYPDKLIFCWIAGNGLNEPAAPLHRAIRDNADYCMPEIYYRVSAAKEFPDFAFTRFNEAVEKLETSAPGISSKILMGIGVHEALFADDLSIEYGDFVEAQIRYIANDPVLRDLPGLAFYAPMKLSQDNIRRLDNVVRKYYEKKIAGRGKRRTR